MFANPTQIFDVTFVIQEGINHGLKEITVFTESNDAMNYHSDSQQEVIMFMAV